MLEIRQTETFERWFTRLRDRHAKARVQARIDRMALGKLGDVKPVGQGVRELRIPYGPGYRVYFVQRQTVIIVLLCGGDKSTQQADIAKAQQLAQELDEE